MRIVVLRGFWLNGQSHPEGSALEVPNGLGQELIHNHKAAPAAEVVADKAIAPATPTPSAGTPARRKKETP